MAPKNDDETSLMKDADRARLRRSPLDLFVNLYWSDYERGAVRSIEEYLRAVGGSDEDLIRAEYDAIRDMSGSPGTTSMLNLHGAVPSSVDPDDRYQVVRDLGHGGMGIVSLAFDRVLGRRVAIKRIHRAGVTNPTLLARFRREATVLSRIDDPGICTIFDTGAWNGEPYISMRFIDGESLASRLERQKRLRSDGYPTDLARSSVFVNAGIGIPSSRCVVPRRHSL